MTACGNDARATRRPQNSQSPVVPFCTVTPFVGFPWGNAALGAPHHLLFQAATLHVKFADASRLFRDDKFAALA